MVRKQGAPRNTSALWFEQGIPHPLPLRIEYLQKSYLRLVFEFEGGAIMQSDPRAGLG